MPVASVDFTHVGSAIASFRLGKADILVEDQL